METATNGRTWSNFKNEEKGKRSWGSRIYTFLASGGLILVIAAGFIIAVIIVSKLSSASCVNGRYGLWSRHTIKKNHGVSNYLVFLEVKKLVSGACYPKTENLGSSFLFGTGMRVFRKRRRR